MNLKLIKNNHDFLISLCKRFLNIEITEFNFKANGFDDSLYLSYNGENYIVQYDDIKEEYVLLHHNRISNKSQSHHYHVEHKYVSLVSLIKSLSTRHSAKDINSKIDKMFSKIK